MSIPSVRRRSATTDTHVLYSPGRVIGHLKGDDPDKSDWPQNTPQHMVSNQVYMLKTYGERAFGQWLHWLAPGHILVAQ